MASFTARAHVSFRVPPPTDFLTQRRTWFLLLGFSLLVCLKQGTKFVTIYAKDKLQATDQDGDMLLFAYALASTVAGCA
eukprot:2432778-Prymnesium_polylepis.1